jgi:hypothetical protein
LDNISEQSDSEQSNSDSEQDHIPLGGHPKGSTAAHSLDMN